AGIQTAEVRRIRVGHLPDVELFIAVAPGMHVRNQRRHRDSLSRHRGFVSDPRR
ncbi:MAG: hypothetical protein HYZ58_04455, partial [Acidobacteria bacterium]|nr:hypothetical protein [Acidobacteriota bacterium]